MNKLIIVASVAVMAAAASAQLYSQNPHTPGATGANGLSSFQGNLGTAGVDYDREVADDFVVTGAGWSINRIVSNWVQFTPGDPNAITGWDVKFFDGTGGAVGSLLHTATITSFIQSTGPGTYFGRPEQVMDLAINPVVLGPGSYFVQIQPLVNHNWFWVSSTPTTPVAGSAAQIQRGALTSAGNDATWPASWQATGPGNAIFPDAYDVAFQLHGQPVPEPATLAALGLGAAAMLRRRRK